MASYSGNDKSFMIRIPDNINEQPAIEISREMCQGLIKFIMGKAQQTDVYRTNSRTRSNVQDGGVSIQHTWLTRRDVRQRVTCLSTACINGMYILPPASYLSISEPAASINDHRKHIWILFVFEIVFTGCLFRRKLYSVVSWDLFRSIVCYRAKGLGIWELYQCFGMFTQIALVIFSSDRSHLHQDSSPWSHQISL